MQPAFITVTGDDDQIVIRLSGEIINDLPGIADPGHRDKHAPPLSSGANSLRLIAGFYRYNVHFKHISTCLR